MLLQELAIGCSDMHKYQGVCEYLHQLPALTAFSLSFNYICLESAQLLRNSLLRGPSITSFTLHHLHAGSSELGQQTNGNPGDPPETVEAVFEFMKAIIDALPYIPNLTHLNFASLCRLSDFAGVLEQLPSLKCLELHSWRRKAVSFGLGYASDRGLPTFATLDMDNFDADFLLLVKAIGALQHLQHFRVWHPSDSVGWTCMNTR